MRKGPAGLGKYYTQVHGDTSYNRRRTNAETRQLLFDYDNESEDNLLPMVNRNHKKPSLLEKIH